MISLKISPVYSRRCQSVSIKDIPSEFSLREHQVKTYQAIQDPEIDVVFNTAMTGDGKSLAAYLPALVDKSSVLAMYPTNELIQDQLEQIRQYCKMFGRDITPECIFSDRLYKLRAELDLGSQASAIDFLAQGHEIVLTNPDIFNLIANFMYMGEHQNPDQLLQTVLDYYDVFLFDEFHIYDVSQVLSVLTAILYVIEQTRETYQRKKFVFLSATPSPLLLESLERSGLRYQIIEGEYSFEDTADKQDWNQICNPFTLHFHAVGRQTETWIQNHYRELVDWFAENPGSRGAIIVNSVAAAKRIVDFLKQRKTAGDFPLSVGENTGLSRQEEKTFAREQSDLLIGTSTVDVGVDFEINYLVFEALDAGSWIQRLGRLGRHSGYERDSNTVAFKNFVAHSLLPRYVAERIEVSDIPKPEIDKATLIACMQNEQQEKRIFSPVNDFQSYQRTWGWLHPAHVINTLAHPRLRDNYDSVREELTQTYSNIFKVDIPEKVKWYYAITQKQPEVIQTAITRFRGESPFMCGILDETDGCIKTYNLLWVLRNAETEWMSKQDFMQAVTAHGAQPHQYRYVDIYLRLLAYRSEPERLQLHYSRPILSQFSKEDYRRVKVRQDFQIECRFQDINRINRSLKRKKHLCLIRPERANELRVRLRLPSFFGIFPLIDSEGNEMSVVFSKDALLLNAQPYIWAQEV